ncbi:MAG: hypothetical protein GTN89_12860 [Acidobacteria bacterium]|nr:hypothetical protein [Acidobacteriota bacterium]NIQ31228.1 hypothetical protein [Acidobacteriota bacterium]
MTLRDQFGAENRLEPGEPAVVIVVSAHKLRKLKKWEIAIRERYEGMRIVRIADVVPSDPPATYEAVAERLRTRVPDEIPVWIDTSRVWASEFGLDTTLPNLLVLGADGSLSGTVRGRFSPESFAELARLIEEPVDSR